jgi:uncharacterized protein (TIGR03435 family)
LAIEAMSLSDLVAWAYNVKTWEVDGGPAWAGSGVRKDRSTLDAATSRFDITAKAEGDAPRSVEEFRTMLQSLLAERFHLTIHRDNREAPVYALVVDKNGPKFHESGPDAPGGLGMRGRGKIAGIGATMALLAQWFSNGYGVDRPVVDQTGLTGHYDFTLEADPLAGATDSTAPSIFTAMPEQLGLRLEPRRAPLQVVVIDHAEMPSSD